MGILGASENLGADYEKKGKNYGGNPNCPLF